MKKVIWMAVIAALLCVCVCSGCTNSSPKKETHMLTHTAEHVISQEDTEQLRKILNNESIWYECEDAGGYCITYELILDDMKYKVNLINEEYPIQYGKSNGNYEGFMNTNNSGKKKMLINILSKWSRREAPYDLLYEKYLDETKESYLFDRYNDERKIMIEPEDAAALQSLLHPQSGWSEFETREYIERDSYKLCVCGMDFKLYFLGGYYPYLIYKDFTLVNRNEEILKPLKEIVQKYKNAMEEEA